MALDGTYTGLKASVADFLNRTDLTAVVPDFITLAEAQMARRFVSRIAQGLPFPRRLLVRADATFSLAAEYVSVPDDYMGPLELILTGADGTVINMDYLENGNFQRKKVANFWRGNPKYYTVVGSQFQIYPVADQVYTGELSYISRFPALSATNSANWILTDYPDAYLYGSLIQSAPYLKDDGRVATWETLFASAVDEICNSDPAPPEMAKLHSEVASLMTPWRSGQYNINTDV